MGKNIWQYLAQLWPKTAFYRCQICLKSFPKWVHIIPKCDFMISNVWDIVSPTYRQSCGYPPTLGWVNLKEVFWQCQIFASQWHFLPNQFWMVGCLFLQQMVQHQNRNWLGIQNNLVHKSLWLAHPVFWSVYLLLVLLWFVICVGWL